MPDRTTLGRAYFALQGAAIVGWWLVLWLVPDARSWFNIHDAPLIALTAFAPGDLLFAAPASLYVAATAAAPDARRRMRARHLAWAVAGVMGYAASYTLAVLLAGESGPLAPALMAPAALLTAWATGAIAGPAAP